MSDVPIYERAITAVEEQFDLSRAFAVAAQAMGEELLNTLAEYAAEIDEIDTNVEISGTDYTPSPFTGEVPTKPNVDMGAFSPPATREFKGLDLSGLEIPDLSGIAPSVGSIDPAGAEYSSTLLTALKARLISDVSTDINRPDIQTAQWNLARERDAENHSDLLDAIRADWSKSGLPLPDGALLAAIEKENTRYGYVYDDRSRDIAINESNLAIKVRQDAITQAIHLENILMNFLQTTKQRLFEASKATVEAQVHLFNLVMQKYRMLTDIYQAVANVKIAEAKTLVEIYLAEVTAYKTKVDAEAARLDALVKAYSAEVDAYKGQVMAYQALSGFEAEILRTQANLAVARAQLYLKNAEIQIKQAESNNGLRIETAKAMGAIIAQELAGALSGIHAQAGMHRQDSASYSLNVSRQE